MNELAAIREKIDNDELMRISLYGFSTQWDMFAQVINGRQNLPNWDHLWSDFTKEKLRLSLVSGRSGQRQECEDDENVAIGGRVLILDNNGMFYALEQFTSIFLISPISVSKLAIT